MMTLCCAGCAAPGGVQLPVRVCGAAGGGAAEGARRARHRDGAPRHRGARARRGAAARGGRGGARDGEARGAAAESGDGAGEGQEPPQQQGQHHQVTLHHIA